MERNMIDKLSSAQNCDFCSKSIFFKNSSVRLIATTITAINQDLPNQGKTSLTF